MDFLFYLEAATKVSMQSALTDSVPAISAWHPAENLNLLESDVFVSQASRQESVAAREQYLQPFDGTKMTRWRIPAADLPSAAASRGMSGHLRDHNHSPCAFRLQSDWTNVAIA